MVPALPYLDFEFGKKELLDVMSYVTFMTSLSKFCDYTLYQ